VASIEGLEFGSGIGRDEHVKCLLAVCYAIEKATQCTAMFEGTVDISAPCR